MVNITLADAKEGILKAEKDLSKIINEIERESGLNVVEVLVYVDSNLEKKINLRFGVK